MDSAQACNHDCGCLTTGPVPWTEHVARWAFSRMPQRVPESVYLCSMTDAREMLARVPSKLGRAQHLSRAAPLPTIEFQRESRLAQCLPKSATNKTRLV